MEHTGNSHAAAFLKTIKTLEQSWPEAEAALRALYDPDISFCDPMFRAQGLDQFLQINRRMLAAARRLQVHVHSIATDGDKLLAHWTFDYKTKLGITMYISGCSAVTFRQGRIVSHLDYWDVINSALSSIPGLRKLTQSMFQTRSVLGAEA